MERETGIEPVTFSLARRCSTTEPLPRVSITVDQRNCSQPGKLGLSQTAAGEIIGGGPRAFQKYEAGDLLPSRAISSALILLDHNPDGLTILRIPDRTSCHNASSRR